MEASRQNLKIFLTGEIQVGKSTIIAKTLDLLQIKPGGFRTYFGPDRKSPDRLLYMNSAAVPPIYHSENAVARFAQGRQPQALPEKFDSLGGELIRSARKNSKLIVMDELGSLEQIARVFQKEVLNSLNGNIPVLGVLKLNSRGWTEKIRKHPQVELFYVTEENRDALPLMLAARLAPAVTA
jgi:nucleoside-triphosphatase